MDDLIADTVENAVEEAVNKVTSGASEAFDTLKEIEEWINENSGKTADLTGYVKQEDLEGYVKTEELPSMEEYATKDYVDGKVGEIVIPSLDGYATEAWVTEQGFITEHQDITGKQDVIDDLETIREGAAKGATALQEVPEGYATEAWVSEQGFITEHQDISGLATKEEVSDAIASIEIPSVEGLATESWVSAEIAKAQLEGEGVDLSGYATKDDIKGFATKGETEAIKTWVGEQGFLTEHQSLEGLATEQFVTDRISEIQIPETDHLATKDEVAKAVEGLATEEFVTNQGYITEHQDISHLATKEEVNEIAKQIPSIDGLATETYVDEKVASINIPSIEGLATEAWVNEQGFLTEHQDITGKQDVIEDLEAIREGAAKGATALQEVPEGYATEAWVGEQGFITEHQDISGLATKEEVANAIAEIEIPSIEGLATEQFVTDEIAKIEIPSIDHLATKEELEIVSGSIKSVIEDLLIPENAKETLDTLEEISAWIQNHPDDAASMNAKIIALTESAHTHENKEVLDGITVEKVSAWDAAEANASAYTDTEIAKLSDVYAPKAEFEEVQKKVEEITSTGGEPNVQSDWNTTNEEADSFIKNKPDLSVYAEKTDLNGLATEAWVGEQGFITEHQDISGLATKEEVSEAVLSAQTYADSLVENLKPYDGGTAVDVVDYTVNVNVAEDGFLKVNEENELTVTGVTLDAAVTSKDITIEGGQWEESVKSVFTDGVVPAGTTWESFLESMLCVEKWATSVSVSTAFTVSCGNINPGIDKSGTVEVGTKVTLNETNANTTNASQSLIVKTFGDGYGKVYGYKMGENDSHVNATAYTETLTPSIKVSEDALKITFSNFTDQLNGGKVLDTISGNTTLPSVVMYAMEGTNVVTVSQTGDTYTASSAVTAGTIYIATNLKNYYKTDKVTPNTIIPTFESTDKTATDSTEYKVIGAHKYFIGDIMDYSIDYWDEDRSSEVRGLETKNWATASTITIAHTFKMGTKQQTVVVPAKYTSVSGKDVNNGDVKFNLVKTFDFTNEQGYISSFKVFVAPATDGLGSDSKITITIK
jgi:hypothetical protein